MKTFALFSLLFSFTALQAQYYYKDIIGTRETAELIKNYMAQNVKRVSLSSFDANNIKSDDFSVEQFFNKADKTLKTITRSDVTDASVLTSFFDDKGNVIKTVDSSEMMISTTVYNYDASGKLISLIISSTDTSRSINETEEHQWHYENDTPVKMWRIKNSKDTTFVVLKQDDKGNIIEEQATRKGIASEPVYYYYNSNNRLTDIVRFNTKAKRLLPEYMFEYSPTHQVIQKITVPSNSSDYLIWRYQYNNQGLKIKEAIFNKQKQLTGKIEYQYQFGS